ncbi:MAG: 50S ribosomal protein L21 [Chloroflexota bacterium]
MLYAIIEYGGKQYKALPGGTIEVDRMPIKVGETVELDRVLLLAEDGKVTVGTPTVPDTKIKATVLAHVKGPKIIVFKYKPKTRYRLKRGHRQKYTRLQVNLIQTGPDEKVTKKESISEIAEPKKAVRKKPAAKAVSKQKAVPAKKKPAAKVESGQKTAPTKKKPAAKVVSKEKAAPAKKKPAAKAESGQKATPAKKKPAAKVVSKQKAAPAKKKPAAKAASSSKATSAKKPASTAKSGKSKKTVEKKSK